jgi:hypothetical protein
MSSLNSKRRVTEFLRASMKPRLAKESPVADQPMLHLFGNGKIEPLGSSQTAETPAQVHAQHQSLKSRLRRPPLIEATIVIGGAARSCRCSVGVTGQTRSA